MRIDAISAVVTGAAGGIGEPICRRLVAGGARVLVVGRSPQRLGKLADSLTAIRAQGLAEQDRHAELRNRVDVVAVDLTSAAGRSAVCAAAVARRANVLIHCAALPSFGRLETLDDTHLERLFATDLIAPIALTRDLLPQLKSVPAAAILSIGSALGAIGVPGFSAYGAAKAGLRAFSESLRRELQGSAIRVQYLSARATRTAFNDARVDRFNELTATKVDPPELVADAALAMLRSGRLLQQLGFPERLFARINAAVPTWIDGGFDRHRLALLAVTPAAAAATRLPAIADPDPLQTQP